jgi:hypothetical protein
VLVEEVEDVTAARWRLGGAVSGSDAWAPAGGRGHGRQLVRCRGGVRRRGSCRGGSGLSYVRARNETRTTSGSRYT